MDFPLTIDVTDQVSLYGGVSGSATRTDLTDWSSFTVNSWNLGFQADLYQQDDGSIPTITLQTTVTRAVPNGPLTTTNFNNIVELDYAFDEDETRGRLPARSTPGSISNRRWRESIRRCSAMPAAIINGRTTGRSPAASACSRSAARNCPI
jgi:hypothetical protein